MTGFILWLVSFISSAGAGMWLPQSSSNDAPTLTTGDCSDAGCGLNGTRITGLAHSTDVAGEIRMVALPSGELLTLR